VASALLRSSKSLQVRAGPISYLVDHLGGGAGQCLA
jgi:hypothetical protein